MEPLHFPLYENFNVNALFLSLFLHRALHLLFKWTQFANQIYFLQRHARYSEIRLESNWIADKLPLSIILGLHFYLIINWTNECLPYGIYCKETDSLHICYVYGTSMWTSVGCWGGGGSRVGVAHMWTCINGTNRLQGLVVVIDPLLGPKHCREVSFMAVSNKWKLKQINEDERDICYCLIFFLHYISWEKKK